MKSLLITGSDGQLGSSIRKVSHSYQFNCRYIDINDVDLTNEDEVHRFFNENRFDYIINCAAFTAVDLAEKNQERVYAVNAGIPAMLAGQCSKGTRIIQLSTDYVYNGSASTPHLEEDATSPLSVYARSKLAGEIALADNPMCMIIRTSWLYGEYGNNFVKTMIRLSKERREINVVYDQIGTPTYSGDLARTIFDVIEKFEQKSFSPGIYNYSNEGVCSWYDLAWEIIKYTGSSCRINPIRTHEYPLPAERPKYSVMDKSKIKRKFGLTIPHWRDSLMTVLNNLATN